MSPFLVPVAILAINRLIPRLSSYSIFNFMFIMTTCSLINMNKSFGFALMPMAICSTYATAITWYTCIFALDRSFTSKMMEANQWSYMTFMFGDVLLHIIPLCIAVKMHRYLLLDHARYILLVQHKYLHLVQHCGLYSLLFHLLWPAVIGTSFNLSTIYVSKSYSDWNILWMVTVLCHLYGNTALSMYANR